MTFSTKSFLNHQFGSPDGVLKLLRKHGLPTPKRPAAEKWFYRDSIPGEWWPQLILALQAEGIGRFDLVIVDTVSQVIPGADENTQKEMTLFVEACKAVRKRAGGVVIGVHHANKGGEEMRGSSVLEGAGDFVFRLQRKKGASVGEVFCRKMKDGPDGWAEHYSFDLVNLGQTAKGKPITSLVPTRVSMGGDGDVEVTPSLVEQVLAAMRKACEMGEPWAKAVQAGERRAMRRMTVDFGLRADVAENLLRVWEQTGVVSYGLVNSSSKRKGYSVKAEPGQIVGGESVFD